jgi:Domain of unknown function (DUF4174)
MNHFLCLSCFYLLSFMPNQDICAQNFDIKDYIWRKRVLLIFAPDAENDSFKRQLSAVKEVKTGFEERDLVVICIFPLSGLDERNKPFNAANAIKLRKKFNVAVDDFKVILLGKDGGAKKTSAQPLDMQQLFRLIDAMPMRRDEVKNGNRK